MGQKTFSFQNQEIPVPQSITLGIDSQLENTVMIAMAVRGICSMTSLTNEEINRIELCVTEVVNNAIEHAYACKKGHKVQVSIQLIPEKEVTITVTDHGKAMPAFSDDWEKNDNKPDPGDPSTWKTSGRGLMIVSKIMSKVDYSSNNKQNSLSMCYQFS